VEGLQLGDGDEDNDSLLASADIDLTGSGDLESTELVFEFGDIVLEVDESLGDAGLSLVGGCRGRVGGAENLAVNGGHLEGYGPREPEDTRSTSDFESCHPSQIYPSVLSSITHSKPFRHRYVLDREIAGIRLTRPFDDGDDDE
jgi:hypothetical protein